MPVIKRYPNRKLYDTEAKQYVTLGQIATLIREGNRITVVDHATSEDLTALTLTQVIFEQEKRRRGFLPQSVLTGLIEAGGETLTTLRRALAHPLNLARHVDEEIEERVQTLISRGELAAEEGRHLRQKLLTRSTQNPGAPWPDDEDLARALAERGVPTREDLQRIFDQLDELSAQLDQMAER
jgi:polyhydroxyalkanoate synthesis repressor PhaR